MPKAEQRSTVNLQRRESHPRVFKAAGSQEAAASRQQKPDRRRRRAAQAHAESSKIWLTGKFTELRLLLEEEEVLAKKFIDKNTQLALQAYREQIKSCEDQIDVLNSLSNRVWSISQETSPVQLLQEFTETEQELKQHMTLEEFRHPVPQSFEPVKTFFKGLMDAMQSMMQTPLEVRLKEDPVLPLEATPLCSCRQSLLGLCYSFAMPALGSQLEWPSPSPFPLPG
ncbi:tripartite motif containing 14 [Phyllostomus discolor]|uniref:Tripartite motif containing 14 n=1 Tax=Phyllostomus discolor TaxID=89673 RepID=A0A834BH55_9CHIR|nr:tripartite motif containing 14 [Phyllostomus discolor]